MLRLWDPTQDSVGRQRDRVRPVLMRTPVCLQTRLFEVRQSLKRCLTGIYELISALSTPVYFPDCNPHPLDVANVLPTPVIGRCHEQ